jgi:hypothetical protein
MTGWISKLTVLLVLGLVAAGCGGGDEEEGGTTEEAPPAEETAGPQEITVTADEYSFELSDDFRAGQATVSLDNVGEEEHELIFVKINEGFTFEEAIQAQGQRGTTEMIGVIPPSPAGELASETIEADLEPGSYGMVCTLRNDDRELHLELGQQLEFPIE